MTAVLFGLVVAIVVVGFLCWLIDRLPIDTNFKGIAKGVLIFFLVLYVIYVVAGLLGIATPPGRLP